MRRRQRLVQTFLLSFETFEFLSWSRVCALPFIALQEKNLHSLRRRLLLPRMDRELEKKLRSLRHRILLPRSDRELVVFLSSFRSFLSIFLPFPTWPRWPV